MLVLTRKERQEIRVGEGVVITVVRIDDDTVRIGITAPTEVKILRGELVEDSTNGC